MSNEKEQEKKWMLERIAKRRMQHQIPALDNLPDLSEWARVEIITIEQAACLYAAIDPIDFSEAKTFNSGTAKLSDFGYLEYQIRKIHVITQAMISSIVTGTLPTIRIMACEGWGNNGTYVLNPSDISPDHLNIIVPSETLLLNSAFRAWLTRTERKTVRGEAMNMAVKQNKVKTATADSNTSTNIPLLTFDPESPKYPIELHAATEAYKNISQLDSLGFRTPKQSITEYLTANFGDRLSNKAIDRAAIVANYEKRDGEKSKA